MPGAEAKILVLFLTTDLLAADLLSYEVRKTTPNLRLETFPGIRLALSRLSKGGIDLVLIDKDVPSDEISLIIAHIDEKQLNLPVVLVFGVDAKDPVLQAMKLGADGRIIKGPDFKHDMPIVVRETLANYRPGGKRQGLRGLGSATAEKVPAKSFIALETRQPGLPSSPDTAASSDSGIPQDQKASNRRISARWQVYIPCHISYLGSIFEACIHDLSDEGAFVESSVSARQGDEIDIILKTASGQMSVRALIAHIGWYLTAVRNFNGFGVRLQNISREAWEVLQQLRLRSGIPAPAKTPLEH